MHCWAANKSRHRFTAEGPVKPGKLEEQSGMELQWNIECMGNKFELSSSCLTQSPMKQRNVQGLDFHPDYISKVNISIIQVVFPFIFIL